MNTDKNTALYEKMAAEQDKFRDWLKSQPPEEILNHAYEYTVREDILMAMEELDLPQSRAAALLASPSPLADVYKEFADRRLPTWMWCGTASSSGPRRRWMLSGNCRSTGTTLPMPVSMAIWTSIGHPAAPTSPARRPSRRRLADNYRDNRLGKDAVPQVIEQFGYTRSLYVLANTVQQKDWDGRFSPANKAWAKTVDIPPTRTALAATATWTSWWTTLR